MIWIWLLFIVFILVILALDLGVFHRKAHVIGVRESLVWSAIWIALSLAFSVFIYFAYAHHWEGLGTHTSSMHPTGLNGTQAVILYLTGYVIEKSLSVDNIFVMALVFGYFGIPAKYQHRVLFWGILGALIMRGLMIAVGAALISRFEWILYIFGVFLLLTAGKMMFSNSEPNPKNNFLVRLTRRWFPVTEELHGQHFMAHIHGRWMLTPLALTLVVVESTDLLFAVDSIPAIFAITTDPFLVFTSNVFAILGLRSLYFALASILEKFYYLKASLAVILGVVGVKMLAKEWLHDIHGMSFYLLGLIALIMVIGIAASVIRSRRLALEPAVVSHG
jgi:tellurite resistance protein TerC